MRFTQTNRLYIGFVVLFLLSVTIGIVDSLTISKQERISRDLNHTYRVLNVSENVLNLVSDMETGRRGYRCTGRKMYLEPYYAAIDKMGSSLADLRNITASDAQQSKNESQLENNINGILLFWSKLRSDEKKYDSTTIASITAEEKTRMDEIRANTQNMETIERGVLRRLESENNRLLALTAWSSPIGSVLAQIFIVMLIYLVISELRKRRKAELELQKAVAAEKQVNELKTRFVTMASHEFRTPLAAINASTYLAAKYKTEEDQPRREKHYQRITASVESLTEILEDLLNVEKLELDKIPVRTREFDIQEYVKSWVSDMDVLLKRGQTISYHHDGCPAVSMDPMLLKHIVANLVSNAIKFSEENDTISVLSYNNGKQLMISVKDTGIGIPKNDMVHLFERFHRANNVSNIEGTGLGLHIAAKYTSLMKGTIQCVSDEGVGTEFILKFPLPETSQPPQ